MRCGVVVFPGSNCDHDVYHVLKHVLGQPSTFLWHDSDRLQSCELVVLPGGFSYGDYLRGGALAVHSPLMAAVRRHADAGGLVLGICNGFQILCEAGMLPGALRPNQSLRFECRDAWVRVERNDLPYTHHYSEGQVLRLPVAHGEGRYVAPEETLDELEADGRVVFRYCSPDGEVADDGPGGVSAWNVNGSVRAIAGITNTAGNVLGMMPHPERCAEEVLGNTDGLALFAAAVEGVVSGAA